MKRSVTWYPKISKLLPADEPLAKLIARLLVLWQDLLYEEKGLIGDKGFDVLDGLGNGDAARRLYFLRGNSRTLHSARTLFDDLAKDPTFAAWLAEDKKLYEDFYTAKKAFDRNRSHVELIRNSIGAHIEEDVGDAIQYFDPSDDTTFEIHREHFIKPYPAVEIQIAAFSKERSPEKRNQAFRNAVKPLAEATGAMIRTMSAVLSVYFERNKLIPDR